MSDKQFSDEMAVIEQAGFDAYRGFAAQALLLARSIVRDQTTIDKPLPDWTVHDIVTALRTTPTRAPVYSAPSPSRLRH
jgi:hypothetical protein